MKLKVRVDETDSIGCAWHAVQLRPLFDWCRSDLQSDAEWFHSHEVSSINSQMTMHEVHTYYRVVQSSTSTYSDTQSSRNTSILDFTTVQLTIFVLHEGLSQMLS